MKSTVIVCAAGCAVRIISKAIFAVLGSVGIASAEPATWQTYTIPETGTSVELPASIFAKQAGSPPHGYGQRFETPDHSADLTVQAAPNEAHDSPAAFLAKMHPPMHIQYKRVTPRFFAVSSRRGDIVWYDRCNFSRNFIHCVLINYPAQEERAWDSIVTRISLSLRD